MYPRLFVHEHWSILSLAANYAGGDGNDELIGGAGADLLAFHPEALPPNEETRSLYVAIGSERGLCGDYNDQVLSAIQERLQGETNKAPVLLSVGGKLAVRLAEHGYVTASIEGPSVAEEVQRVIVQVMDRVQELQTGEAPGLPLTMTVISHLVETREVVAQPLRAFEDAPRPIRRFTDPPLLNLPSRLVLRQLIELFLFSLLHKIFYGALLAENRARVSHLEGAIQHLEKEASELERKRNGLRPVSPDSGRRDPPRPERRRAAAL